MVKIIIERMIFMAKNLVVYYSRKGENFFPGGIRSVEKGNTAYAAEYIAEAVDADLFEVDTIKPYAESYRACCMEASLEAKANARPAIKSYYQNVESYDNIFVCYPCWCGTAPMCIFTFLDYYDFAGKKIIPVCTNEGSGMANSVGDLISACPGATVTEGLSIKGHQCADSKEMLTAWAKEQI